MWLRRLVWVGQRCKASSRASRPPGPIALCWPCLFCAHCMRCTSWVTRSPQRTCASHPGCPGEHCSCLVSCCVVACVGCCVGPMPSMRPGSWVVFVHCSAYDPTRKFLRDPTPAGNTPMVDEAALLAGPGHHASHTSALVSSSFNTTHGCGCCVCGVGEVAHRRAGAVTGMWVALRWTTCTAG